MGLGLMLFCLRALKPGRRWNERWIRIAFWGAYRGTDLSLTVSLTTTIDHAPTLPTNSQGKLNF